MSIDLLPRIKWISGILVLALGLSLSACSSPEQRAQAHYESGMELLKQGDFVKASLEFRNALKYNEKLAVAWAGLAAVEEKKGNWPIVVDALQRAVELDPTNAPARLKLAKLQLAAVKLDVALSNVNAANDLQKDDPDTLALRAAILFRLNDREGARADAERALSLNADNADALAILAADQITDGNTAAALRFIDRGLSKDPNNLGLLMFKLKIFEDSKDDPKLEAVLRQIVAAHPAINEIRQALLAFLVSRNRIADAETEMRTIVAINPNDTVRTLELVRFLAATKGPGSARAELDKLIAAQPEVADYRFALAQINFNEKRAPDAISAIEAVIAKGAPEKDVQRGRLLLANMNMQLGQAATAQALIAEVLAGDEKNAEALALRANLSLDSGQVDSAVSDLREALNQQPNSVALLMLLGRAHERQGAVELANDRIAQAVKSSNYSPQIALDYIAFLERRGKKEDAAVVLTEAAARNPNDLRLLKALAQLKLYQQDWVGAQAAAEALKKVGDASGVSEQVAGLALFGQQKYEESIETFKAAITAAPDSVQPMYNLVFAYIRADKMADAESFLQSALAANQNNADALVLMGTLNTLQKKPLEAEASFKLAITQQPASALGYVALAKHHLSQNQQTEAEATLRIGHEKAPNDLALNLLLASLLEAKNDTDGAIKIYEVQLKATPDALIAINNLASLLADFSTDAESLDRAHQLAQRLEAIDVPQFRDTVGWVAYRRGEFRNALQNLEQAAEKMPDNALVRYHLGMTYAALKREADARDQFAKAEALLKANDPLKERIRSALASL